jgi:hypothetical protein
MPENQRIRTATTQDRIEAGDNVAYAQAFLDRHSQYPNGMPAAQGTVKQLHRLDNGTVLADIEWNKPGLPKRVNVKNLTKAQSPPPGD